MALAIGGGITIGGGVSVVEEVAVATPDITGTLTIGSGGAGYGYDPGVPFQYIPGFGSRTSNPSGIIRSFLYNTNNLATQIMFQAGTYTGANGSLNVTDTKTINGASSYLVKIGSITQTLTAGASVFVEIAGDPFNIQAQNGSTVSFEITLL